MINDILRTVINTLMGVFALIGSVLIVSPIHEFSHIVVAKLSGHNVIIDNIVINSGSITVLGKLSPLDSSLIAMSGIIGVVAVGLIFIYLTRSHTLHICGVVLLSRAWVDSIPQFGTDGYTIAQNSSMYIALIFSGIVIIISGMAAMSFMNELDASGHTHSNHLGDITEADRGVI